LERLVSDERYSKVVGLGTEMLDAHVDLALAGPGTVSTWVRTQSFLRREHSRADELFAGYADLTKFAVNGRRRSQADESLRYFEEEVRPMSR
jgi:hypothetical protein